ncbi:MAG: hypothetical protein LBU81_01915 [Methanosarcinales archaeon]|nr:hypothetical protein [Methanosarcinales archaeon]
MLQKNLEGIVRVCKENRLDWPINVVGAEGSGKSTLAAHISQKLAEMTGQELDLAESMIYSFDERDRHGAPLKNSLVGFVDKYQSTEFKILWYDEAVTVLFSDEHATRESKEAKKLFITKRDMCHFDILVSPSPFHIIKDIRSRRVKTMIYCFIMEDPETKRFKHKYAWYSADKIVSMSYGSNQKKAEVLFRRPKQFINAFPPDFIEDFPKMTQEFEEKYLLTKRTFMKTYIDSLVGGEKTAADLVLPENFSFIPVFDKLVGKTAGGEEAV